MTTNFAKKPRRDDPQAALVVEQNLEQLRDVYDTYIGKRKRGSATITNPATTATVTHGLGNTSYQVSVAPLADPNARVWVSGKTATQFVINVSAAPAGALAFDWIVEGA